MPLQPLEHEPRQPPKRVGFLSKCNPKATWRSVVRSAAIYSFAGAGLWLFGASTKEGFWSTWPVTLPGLMIAGAIAGAVCEWQVDWDQL
jgi:fatty acid desaturase